MLPQFHRSSPLKFAASLLVLSLLLPGCTTGTLAIAGDDPCRAERENLKGIDDYIVRSTVTGAMVGAAAGGLAGVLIGRDTKSALIGAGTGALAGGAGGYLLAKRNASSNQASLVTSVYTDVASDNQNLDRTTTAFRALRDCRFRTASAVKADYAASRVERDAAASRLARIRTLFQEDVAYAEQLGAKMDERGNEFRFASDELVRQDPEAQRTLSSRPSVVAAPAPRAAPRPAPQRPRPAESAAGDTYTVRQAARVREEPSTEAAQIASLSPGDRVTVVAAAEGDWLPVRLGDGRSGYVSKRLLEPAGAVPVRGAPPVQTAAAPPPAPPPPPQTVVGVAELTESNQLKRRAFSDDVVQAKAEAASAFELDGKISRGHTAPPGAVAAL